MSEDPKVVYRPRPDTTPEDEISALAAAYRLILRTHAAREKGVRHDTQEGDLMEENNAQTAKRIISG